MRTPGLPLVGRLSGGFGGLALRLLVGFALLDADLEEVAHQHPRLALLLGQYLGRLWSVAADLR